ncbi:hypothetical protein D1007_47147 [Hordeum vulgare]|nr:hypothetical protein D1007_47147 [Hordeum vulgare]
MAALWCSATDKVPYMPTYRTPEAASHNGRQEWQPWAGIGEMREQTKAGKDEYIERIQLEGASRELDLPLEAEKFGSGPSGSGAPISSNSIGATVGNAGGTIELKKLNKKMKKLIELKKQGNLMAEFFYVCVIALAFVYVMIISR